MWSVHVNGVWQSVSTEQVRDLAQRGLIGPETVVRHDTWKEPGRLGQVQAFAALFPKVEALRDEDVQIVGEAPFAEGYRSAPGFSTAPGLARRTAAATWDLSALVPMMRPAGLIAGGIAGLTCIFAGLYMLSWTSQAEADKGGMFGGTTNFFSVLKTASGSTSLRQGARDLGHDAVRFRSHSSEGAERWTPASLALPRGSLSFARTAPRSEA